MLNTARKMDVRYSSWTLRTVKMYATGLAPGLGACKTGNSSCPTKCLAQPTIALAFAMTLWLRAVRTLWGVQRGWPR